MEHRIIFQEEQKFTQWWLWVILLVPVGFLCYKLIQPILDNSSFAEGNYSISMLLSSDIWISFLIMCLLLVLFFILQLKTSITSETLVIRYYPLFTKKWKWTEVQTAELVTYGFVGYGIRISFKYGMVYNVRGNKGLAITFKNGKKILIGTQKPDELEQKVQTILNTL